MKSKQLRLVADNWPMVGSMGSSERKKLAAACRQLNADAHLLKNLNKDALRDAQVRWHAPHIATSGVVHGLLLSQKL